jgi:hypothetical protein
VFVEIGYNDRIFDDPAWRVGEVALLPVSKKNGFIRSKQGTLEESSAQQAQKHQGTTNLLYNPFNYPVCVILLVYLVLHLVFDVMNLGVERDFAKNAIG